MPEPGEAAVGASGAGSGDAAGLGPVPRFLLARWPELAIGFGTAVYGLAEARSLPLYPDSHPLHAIAVAVLTALSAALFRTLPGAALALAWITAGLDLVSGVPALQTQLTAALVAYGAACRGSTAVLWLSGLSVPLGTAAALEVRTITGMDAPRHLTPLDWQLEPALKWAPASLLATAVFAVLAVPWLVGLVQRVALRAARDRADAEARRQRAEARRERAETQRGHAQEVAALRERQATMARDVHDVVGHSLAVILVQAESAQYLAQSDPAALRQALSNIAASSRQSLQEVRAVLSSIREEPGDRPAAGTVPGTGDLDSLLDGIEAAGNPLRSEVVGTPRQLSPGTEAVAFRVLQEMLTNALKHGRRGGEVAVSRTWGTELRLEVRNMLPDTEPGTGTGTGTGTDDEAVPERGSGIDGMRRRLEAVDGTLELRRLQLPGAGPVFTAVAELPL